MAVPPYVGIEITRRCNQRCPHCFTDSGPSEGPGIPPERLKWLLAELAQAGVQSVAFSGGEPLLRRDLEGTIAFGRSKGLGGFGVVTNGAAVTALRARQLAAAGLVIAQVSLDGVDAADYVAVRACAPAEYDRAVQAIGFYREAGIRVDIACLLTGRNLERAPEMVRLAQALGVTQLRYCSYVPTGRGRGAEVRDAYPPTPEQMDRFLDFMAQLNEVPERPLNLTIDHGIGPSQASGAFHCSAGTHVVYIDVEGNLYPCPGTIFPGFAVGNVYQEPVAELLVSPALGRLKAVRKEQSKGPCSTCLNARCSGGCRGGVYAQYGDLNRSPDYCRVRRRRQQESDS